MEVLETFFHQLYAEIMLERKLMVALGEKLKNMFKIKK